MYMLYDKGKVRLPNPSLGLYVVLNYLIEIAVAPVNQRAPQRVASERIATHQEHTWQGSDHGPEEAAHLHYRDYNPESLEPCGFSTPNQRSQCRRHGRKGKITNGQIHHSDQEGILLIHLELQGLSASPNLMQDDTSMPPVTPQNLQFSKIGEMVLIVYFCSHKT